MATADLLDTDLVQSIVDGFIQYDYTRRYQVVFDAGDAGDSVQALNATGLPLLGAAVNVDGVTVWCNRRTPRREAVDQSRRKWLVDCTFTNATQKFDKNEQGAPTSDPEQIVKEVDVSFIEDREPIDGAKFLGLFRNNIPFPSIPEAFANRITTWMPILWSNGRAAAATRPVTRKAIRVTRYAAMWLGIWDDYLFTVNSDTVTIVQRDGVGEKLSQEFPPRTLLMNDVTKQDVWKNGILYFKVTFSMLYNKLTWIHRELDHDTVLYAYPGQLKDATGAVYTQAEIDKLKNPHQAIKTDADTSPIVDPVPLNGNGAPLAWNPGNKQEIYLHYQIFEEKAFGPLGL